MPRICSPFQFCKPPALMHRVPCATSHEIHTCMNMHATRYAKMEGTSDDNTDRCTSHYETCAMLFAADAECCDKLGPLQ